MLFTDDFSESNFTSNADDPDKSYKSFTDMNTAMISLYNRSVVAGAKETSASKLVMTLFENLPWECYKRMIVKLEERGHTLIDYKFDITAIVAALNFDSMKI